MVSLTVPVLSVHFVEDAFHFIPFIVDPVHLIIEKGIFTFGK
jgi:hypothetical protein